jgi:hypothetical protein
VAACVSDALTRAGIRAVLTGGACATLYSRGAYESFDLDFVLQSAVPPKRLDQVMRGIGFRRRPVAYQVGRIEVLVLSATDSCRGRLAAFYHRNDRQSLAAALAIARRHKVNLEGIRRWSRAEGATAEYREFLGLLGGPTSSSGKMLAKRRSK